MNAPAIHTHLSRFNLAPPGEAIASLLSCCAAHRWAAALIALRPFANDAALFTFADQVWETMQEADWIEAFSAHPRIGERKPVDANAQSKAWSSQEQVQVQDAHSAILSELAAGNREYEQSFGFTYIVCATGKSAEEMLAILKRRLGNSRGAELREAAEQQRQITQIRLRKWLEA